LHGYLNGIGLREGDPPVDVHRVGPVYWDFNSEGIRDRDSYFNRVGTFYRVWHFNWDSFENRDRSVYYNWVGVIDRDFDLDGVGFRDSNWDSDRVRFGLRDSYRDFNRVGSVNRDSDFNREGVRNRDLFQHGIGTVNWYRDLDANWVGFSYFNSLFDDLLPGIEAAKMFAGVSEPGPETVAMSRKTPFRGAALRGR
jgi:hypothetical protein